MLVWRAPVDTVSHGKWKYGGKMNKLYFLFGNRLWYIYHGKCWEQSFSLVGKVCLSKCFYLSSFALSSGTSTNPYFPPWRAFLLLYGILFLIWVSIFSYKAPTKGHHDRTWALGVANMRVCFMNGSMLEHDGLGITYFSIDILKDLVACWYAWVSKLSCQN